MRKRIAVLTAVLCACGGGAVALADSSGPPAKVAPMLYGCKPPAGTPAPAPNYAAVKAFCAKYGGLIQTP